MQEQQQAQLAFSYACAVYKDILRQLPDLFETIDALPESRKYYADAVKRDINFSGNVLVVACEDAGSAYARTALQQSGIPFNEVNASAVPAVRANGSTVFLCRTFDLKRVNEAMAHAAEQFRAAEQKKEEEREASGPERSLDEESEAGAADEEASGEDATDEPPADEEEPEEDKADEDPEADKKSARQKQRRQTGHGADGPAAAEPSAFVPPPIAPVPEPEPLVQARTEPAPVSGIRMAEPAPQPEILDDYRDASLQNTPAYGEPRRGVAEAAPEAPFSAQREEPAEGETAREASRTEEPAQDAARERTSSPGGPSSPQEPRSEAWETSQAAGREASLPKPGTLSEESHADSAPSKGSVAGHAASSVAAQQPEGTWAPAEEPGRPGDSGAPADEAWRRIRNSSRGNAAANGPKTRDFGSSVDGTQSFMERMGYKGLTSEAMQAEAGITLVGFGTALKERQSVPNRPVYGMAPGTPGYPAGEPATEAQPAEQKAAAAAKPAEAATPAAGKTAGAAPGKMPSRTSIGLPYTVGQDIADSKHIDRSIRAAAVSRKAGAGVRTMGGFFDYRNYKGANKSLRRMATQTVFSRETAGGGILATVVDYSAPVGAYIAVNTARVNAQFIVDTVKGNSDLVVKVYAAQNKLSVAEAQKQIADVRKYDLNRVFGKTSHIFTDEEKKVVRDLFHLQGSKNIDSVIAGLTDKTIRGMMLQGQYSAEFRKIMQNIASFRKMDARILQKLAAAAQTADEKAMVTMLEYRLFGAKANTRPYTLRSVFSFFLSQAAKHSMQSSEGFGAMVTIFHVSKMSYGTYRSAMKLFCTVLGKLPAGQMNPGTVRMMKIAADPIKAVSTAASRKAGRVMGKTAGRASKAAAKAAAKQAKSAARKAGRSILYRRMSDLWLKAKSSKYVTLVTRTQANVTTFMQKKAGDAARVAARVAATASHVLAVAVGIVLAIVIVTVLLQNAYSRELGDERAQAEAEKYPHNYVFAQNTEILNEVADELQKRNENFMLQINSAAHNRNFYDTQSGIDAGTNVSQYESYDIVFRDFNGNELDKDSVDLNNTKAILAMATKYLPYPFTELSNSATEEERTSYEQIKQHFEDYCILLWAETHQISVEEYHPGHGSSVSGASDDSGLVTNDLGKCDKDGTVAWLPKNFTPQYFTARSGSSSDDEAGREYCPSCQRVEETGYGEYGDDLCTNGEESTHGGWERTEETRVAIHCKAEATGTWHHAGNRRHDNYEEWRCDEYADSPDDWHVRSTCKHVEYKWVYHCGGHKSAVVYVTIGDLSRYVGNAANDVDYSALDPSASGDPVSGSDVENFVASDGEAGAAESSAAPDAGTRPEDALGNE